MGIKLSKSYPIGDCLEISVQKALEDFEDQELPRTICMFLSDIPNRNLLQVTLIARIGVCKLDNQTLVILSGAWWQTFAPGNFAFLLSPWFF